MVPVEQRTEGKRGNKGDVNLYSIKDLFLTRINKNVDENQLSDSINTFSVRAFFFFKCRNGDKGRGGICVICSLVTNISFSFCKVRSDVNSSEEEGKREEEEEEEGEKSS